jgi:regulatory protein YycI of two-component signal transduction system YycFG
MPRFQCKPAFPTLAVLSNHESGGLSSNLFYEQEPRKQQEALYQSDSLLKDQEVVNVEFGD